MPLFSRSDADCVSNESTLRRLMPFIIKRRNDAVVYFEQNIDVTNLLEYLDARKKNQKEQEITLFHVVLTAMMRAAHHWPKMNRYISGKRIYQRKGIGLSFAVKKKMSEDAGMTVVKKEFVGNESLFEVAKRIDESISVGRGKKLTKSEKEMKLINFVPNFMVSLFIWLQQKLDALNLLPDALTRDDPMFTSIFLANLGSFGLEPPFHHLYEYGTASVFAAIGSVHKAARVDENGQVVARDMVCVRYSFDERAADGVYSARALSEFAQTLQNPSILEIPSCEAVRQEARAMAGLIPASSS